VLLPTIEQRRGSVRRLTVKHSGLEDAVCQALVSIERSFRRLGKYTRRREASLRPGGRRGRELSKGSSDDSIVCGVPQR